MSRHTAVRDQLDAKDQLDEKEVEREVRLETMSRRWSSRAAARFASASAIRSSSSACASCTQVTDSAKAVSRVRVRDRSLS